MKKQKLNKKLNLNKSTISNLSLSKVMGGEAPRGTSVNICNRTCICATDDNIPKCKNDHELD